MDNWSDYAKRMLRAQMTLKRVSYADLVTLLADDGVTETSANLRNKVSRGGFSAAFMLQCLHAMEVTNLHLDPM